MLLYWFAQKTFIRNLTLIYQNLSEISKIPFIIFMTRAPILWKEGSTLVYGPRGTGLCGIWACRVWWEDHIYVGFRCRGQGVQNSKIAENLVFNL